MIVLSSFGLYAQGTTVNSSTIFGLPSSETRQADSDVVANYFDYLFKTGNFEAMAKIIAPDAVYSQAEGLPYGGTYVGFSEWVKMFTKAQSLFDLRIEEEPNYFTSTTKPGIFIKFKIKCKSKKSGKEISMLITEYFEVKDGLIIAIRPYYFDTKSFVEFLN